MTSDRLPDRDSIHAKLLAWYRANRRDLPWRRTCDPYRILVSEVMLQQTQVDRVIPKYHAFLECFPTLQALADAPTADVIRAWSGLGYNRRAVNLQRAAQAVVERHGRVMPRERAALEALPGIGRYTAGAVACFAYEQDEGFIDTNIRRVLHRVFLGPDLPQARATPRELEALAEELVPAGEGYDWNQGLIELGALVCAARTPRCLVCPLQAECRAFPEIQTIAANLPKGSRTKREAPFGGSTRYYRGRLIEALRELETGEAIDLAALGPRVREGFRAADLPWLRDLVAGLTRDGLAVAEERVAYNIAEPAADDDLGQLRVRLP